MKIVYFGRCVPWIIIDAIPYGNCDLIKYRLSSRTVGMYKTPLFSHFTIEMPAVRLHLIFSTRTGDADYLLVVLSTELVVPPNGRDVWHADLPGSLPVMENGG